MRFFLLLLLALPLTARGDLYRWVDAQSGSVKFSSYPPPWYGDPEKEARAPRVEVIRSEQPRPPQAEAPAKAPAKPGAAADRGALESRLATLLQFFKSLPASGDFDRTGAAFQRQADMYRAVSAELDRMDPAGAARRRAAAQETGILEQLRKGLEAQFGTKPPPPPPLPQK